jgi:hypothetical protein
VPETCDPTSTIRAGSSVPLTRTCRAMGPLVTAAAWTWIRSRFRVVLTIATIAATATAAMTITTAQRYSLRLPISLRITRLRPPSRFALRRARLCFGVASSPVPMSRLRC